MGACLGPRNGMHSHDVRSDFGFKLSILIVNTVFSKISKPEFTMPATGCGQADPRPFLLNKIHYLHFALILAPIVAIITVIISLLTPPIPKKHVSDNFRLPTYSFSYVDSHFGPAFTRNLEYR